MQGPEPVLREEGEAQEVIPETEMKDAQRDNSDERAGLTETKDIVMDIQGFVNPFYERGP
ncbi:hypothetical protein [Pedobacter sp. KBW06]|uniref:hypothetical protein n=1 Tax=Pedobacter sp. KBW06 TaxID=2153359 RepID=UPI000F597E5F|nr:hypothetical protein [Pedobacter sp. KBW06]